MAVVAFPMPRPDDVGVQPARRTRRREAESQPRREAESQPRLRPVAAPGTRSGTLPAAVLRRRIVWSVGTLIAVLALAVSAFQVLIAQSEFELAGLQANASSAEDRYDRLRLEVAELESPARIMAAAQERLGMVPPPGVTYLTPVPTESATPSAGRTAPVGETVAGDWTRIKPILATRP